MAYNFQKFFLTIRRILLISVILLLILLGSTIFYLTIAVDELDKLDFDKLKNIGQSSFVYDCQDKPIYIIHGPENRIKVSFNDIPEHVKNAFIAVEDVRFYKHHGFDIKRIFGALLKNIKAGKYVQGASTITQQVIRNAYLSREKTITRKLKEICLAYQLEKRYSKDQILEIYLNLIYFGKGAYGIEAASRTYFGKSVTELSVAEGALLAGIPKNPSKYSPFINFDEATKRKNLVIDLMVKNGFISKEEGERAKKRKIRLSPRTQANYPHGYFMDMVLKEAAEKLGIKEKELCTNGYRIYTTLDSDLQCFVEQLYKQDDYFPKSTGSGEHCESAVVILDSSTGEVRALLGGREYDTSIRKGLNRAVQSRRQPGSAIKPILVYAPAIENFGYTPVTFIEDAPVKFGTYSPSNYDGKYRGPITVRYCIAHSINVPAVKILHEIGVNNGISFASKLGIPFSSHDYNNLAIALGGLHKGITPVELARAYTALADRGYYKNYTTIRRIENSYGVILYESKPSKTKVMSEETAFILSNILQSTIEEGTASRLKSLKLPLAAKTGTVQLPRTPEFSGIEGTKDAWIVVYNPDYVITIWMGFDKTDSKHYLPKKVTGGSYPAEIAKQIVAYLFNSTKPKNFQKPPGVVEVQLDAKSLWERKKVLLASPLTPPNFILKEYFTRETVPEKESDYWVVPQPPCDFSVTLNADSLPILSFTPQEIFALYEIYRTEDNQMLPLKIHEVKTNYLKKIEWIDKSVSPGKKYGYYIVPLHPEIIIDGKPIHGTPTPTISVEIPKPEKTTVELKLKD